MKSCKMILKSILKRKFERLYDEVNTKMQLLNIHLVRIDFIINTRVTMITTMMTVAYFVVVTS